MKRKTYAVTEGFEDGKHFYDIAYCPSLKIDKEIRFSKIEHYLQFVDLLAEAGYRYFDEKLQAHGGVEEIHLSR